MSTATIDISPEKEAIKTEIPAYLIYEMYMGQPIYYRGYEEVLAGKKTFEQIMGDSGLQGWLKTWLGHVLINLLHDKGYDIIVGELGIKFEKGNFRAADVAIFKPGTLKLDNEYVTSIPEFIFEIDTKANTNYLEGDMKYITEKTNQYLAHGVKKVIWIFTNAGAVMEATNQNSFQINSWEKDLEIMEGVIINIAQLVEGRRTKPD